MMIAKRVILALTALVLCGVVAAGISVWHQGYRVYVIHTGSMIPALKLGDVVIDKPAQQLHRGEIITFRQSATSNVIVTHRIHSLRHGIIRTKGDANPTPDVFPVDRSLVRGTVMTVVPKLGYLIVFFKQPAGIGAAMTAALALLLLWDMFFSDGAAQEAVVNAVRRRGAHRATPPPKGRHALQPASSP
jgi:signal peptidase